MHHSRNLAFSLLVVTSSLILNQLSIVDHAETYVCSWGSDLPKSHAVKIVINPVR